MAKDRDKLERDRLVLEEKRLNLQGGRETSGFISVMPCCRFRSLTRRNQIFFLDLKKKRSLRKGSGTNNTGWP